MKSSINLPESKWAELDESYRQKILPSVKTIRGATFLARKLRHTALNEITESREEAYYIEISGKKIIQTDKEDFTQVITEREALKYLLSKIDGRDIESAIDAGAYHGFYTLLMAKCWKTDNIIAYEPDERNFRKLRKNIALNELGTIQLKQEAVWDKSETIKMQGTSDVSNQVGNGRDEVKAIKIDNLEIEPDLVKIDVEGAELKALHGAKRKIERHKPKIILEVHKNDIKEPFKHETKELEDFLEKRNYSINKIEVKNNRELWYAE